MERVRKGSLGIALAKRGWKGGAPVHLPFAGVRYALADEYPALPLGLK